MVNLQIGILILIILTVWLQNLISISTAVEACGVYTFLYGVGYRGNLKQCNADEFGPGK